MFFCLAQMSDEGLEQRYIKEAFDTSWVTLKTGDLRYLALWILIAAIC